MFGLCCRAKASNCVRVKESGDIWVFAVNDSPIAVIYVAGLPLWTVTFVRAIDDPTIHCDSNNLELSIPLLLLSIVFYIFERVSLAILFITAHVFWRIVSDAVATENARRDWIIVVEISELIASQTLIKFKSISSCCGNESIVALFRGSWKDRHTIESHSDYSLCIPLVVTQC